ncbi:MAG: hypothetical protein WDA28_13165 [Castellaniella sp.]
MHSADIRNLIIGYIPRLDNSRYRLAQTCKIWRQSVAAADELAPLTWEDAVAKVEKIYCVIKSTDDIDLIAAARIKSLLEYTWWRCDSPPPLSALAKYADVLPRRLFIELVNAKTIIPIQTTYRLVKHQPGRANAVWDEDMMNAWSQLPPIRIDFDGGEDTARLILFEYVRRTTSSRLNVQCFIREINADANFIKRVLTPPFCMLLIKYAIMWEAADIIITLTSIMDEHKIPPLYRDPWLSPFGDDPCWDVNEALKLYFHQKT